MPRIIIGSSVIEFPNSGQDPNWSEAVIDFAEAVELALAAQGSPFDVAPRVQTLTSDSNSALDLSDAIFPSDSVRSFSLYYAVYRTNATTSLIQQGEVRGIYDTFDTTWVLQDQFNGDVQANGIPYQSFAMSGDQLTFSTVAMGGAYDPVESTISFSAKTQLTVE